MPPSKRDVQAMVVALFTLIGGIERATRQSKGASSLSLRQVIAGRDQSRPSEIAARQDLHPSLVTRQVRELEDLGYVHVSADPADRRACLVTITPKGADEVARLEQVGLQRFATFVADWTPSEVQTLTALLEKLEASRAAAGPQDQRRRGPGWAQQSS
ncbi:MAG: MarR family winged helix-turn-helix transcriptional regulator [Candidatus Dormiibacterota bacterium]